MSAPVVLLVGRPNAGKSALFGRLSGAYAHVSNYPGTTVEVARAAWGLNGAARTLVDTPGLHGLVTRTEEEAVARRMLADERPAAVVHVADAGDLSGHLSLTFQLLEAGLPVVVALNMLDEARRAGVEPDPGVIERTLGVPVVACSAATGEGTVDLSPAVGRAAAPDTPGPVVYPAPVEAAAAEVVRLLPAAPPCSPRGFALRVLEHDEDALAWLRGRDPLAADRAERVADRLDAALGRPAALAIAVARQRLAGLVAGRAAVRGRPAPRTLRDRAGDWLLHPVPGFAVAAAVVYLGLYQLVGGFGAGVLVDFLEDGVFGGWINPAVERAVAATVPWAPVRDLIAGEYGVVTLGLRYAFAVILPMVALFFLVFALIEDSGYLPRLAHLLDGAFKRIGLSGRAVIPVALGFGCDTMATLVTRTLATRRERVITTLLLALAIPCSAQLGVIIGLLRAHPAALATWAVMLAGTFFLTGFLAARVLPGGGPVFFLEIPPLRAPSARNVWFKTWSRVKWYMREVIPLFLLASVLIWLGRLTGLFDRAVAFLAVPLGWLGLPAGAAPAFVFGFFRRDYGAAGLYDLSGRGALNPAQLTVAAVTLTLFLPCVAQFLLMGRERGWRAASAIAALVTGVALAGGWTVARLLPRLGAASW